VLTQQLCVNCRRSAGAARVSAAVQIKQAQRSACSHKLSHINLELVRKISALSSITIRLPSSVVKRNFKLVAPPEMDFDKASQFHAKRIGIGSSARALRKHARAFEHI
jgi:hypothetical protein